MADYDWRCQVCDVVVLAGNESCTNCGNPGTLSSDEFEHLQAEWKLKLMENNGVILSTTPNLEGYKIASYKGLVVGEAVLGANIVKDIFAGIRDIVGGRSQSYESELKKARATAFSEIAAEALKLNANAVVGIDLDYEVMGTNGSIIMVSVSGTAVLIEKN